MPKSLCTRIYFVIAIMLGLLTAAVSAETAAPRVSASATKTSSKTVAPVPLKDFFVLLGKDDAATEATLKRIEASWRSEYAAPLLEILNFAENPRATAGIMNLIEHATGGLKDGGSLDEWYQWAWTLNPGARPDYAEFKATLYEQIDPRFREYFANQPKADIRLDEIRWGGVRRDGIPPLKNPKMIPASEAGYLQDSNIVFGVAIDGDIRAYPKRLLAWHEMFKDRIAGRELNGVYCTLCGTMILYDTTVDGVQYELGTSGFLYRSNKLMYDHATKSMWSTLGGTPVVGPLVGKGIELKKLFVVTTTWGEWRRRHPKTTVLSPDTGHERDYREGAAYRNYFNNDRLMFTVPKIDTRLSNKAEVLALRFNAQPGAPAGTQSGGQLAIAANFLSTKRVYHDQLGNVSFVVLTDASGANRVYETAGQQFASWNGDNEVRDTGGGIWRAEEAQLSGPAGAVLKRLPAHRAFWFGWVAQYPTTRLVK